MSHDCPTGHHQHPSYVCYQAHGCRCDGCRRDKVRTNRIHRHGGTVSTAPAERVDVSVPARAWTRIVQQLRLRGQTPDEFLHHVAQRIGR